MDNDGLSSKKMLEKIGDARPPMPEGGLPGWYLRQSMQEKGVLPPPGRARLTFGLALAKCRAISYLNMPHLQGFVGPDFAEGVANWAKKVAIDGF